MPSYVEQAVAWDKAKVSIGWNEATPEGKCVKCLVPTIWIDPKRERRHPWCATPDMFVPMRNAVPAPHPPEAPKDKDIF